MGGGKEEEEDLISHLMDVICEDGKGLTDVEIADNILPLMDAGHDTSSTTMMMLVKYLAELPECCERVLAGESLFLTLFCTFLSLGWSNLKAETMGTIPKQLLSSSSSLKTCLKQIEDKRQLINWI